MYPLARGRFRREQRTLLRGDPRARLGAGSLVEPSNGIGDFEAGDQVADIFRHGVGYLHKKTVCASAHHTQRRMLKPAQGEDHFG